MEPLSNKDVAPKLYEQLEKRLKGALSADPKIRDIKKKIKNKSVKQSDAWIYAGCVSKHTSNALKYVLTPLNLPDGVLYWNIAERTVKPIIKLSYSDISNMTATIQGIIWEKQGIGLKPKIVSISDDRVNAFINKLVTVGGADNEE